MEGYKFLAVPFLTVGENTIDIQDIVLSGSEGFGSESFSLWEGAPSVLDGSEYSYWLEMDGFYYWEDANFGTDFSMEPGQGFVIQAADSSIAIQFAGEVSDKPVTFDLCDGYNFFGNPFAAPISIQNIVIEGSEGFGMESFSLWEGNPSVVEDSEYSYWLEMDGFYYWEDANFGTDFTIQPGQGFVIQCGSSGLTVTINPPYSLEK